jgi:hypothetical protein
VYSGDNNDDDVVSLTSLASSLSSLSIVLSSLSIVLAEKRKTARATFTRFRFRRNDFLLGSNDMHDPGDNIFVFSGLMGVISPKVLRVHCHISAKVASLGRYFRLCCMARTVISYCSFHAFQDKLVGHVGQNPSYALFGLDRVGLVLDILSCTIQSFSDMNGFKQAQLTGRLIRT